ncbi:MAG: hypothetical protein ABW352_16530 [Polyangiales bacterium]
MCRSEGPAAGVASGPVDPGFLCGVRRRHAGERICVDFAPDVPDSTRTWGCRMERTRGRAERLCEPARSARAQLGAACEDDARCVDGARCIERVCVPGHPKPECWLDADCEQGERCRWGTCAS